MKFFCYLIIALTVLLSSTPCCAGDECCNEGGKCSENSADHQEQPVNSCSPFMVCGSCIGFVVISANLDMNTEPEITNTPNTPYIQSYLGSYNIEFWQPPKIS